MSACFIFDQANAIAEDWKKAKDAGNDELAAKFERRWIVKRYEAIHYWDSKSWAFGSRKSWLPLEEKEKLIKEEMENNK